MYQNTAKIPIPSLVLTNIGDPNSEKLNCTHGTKFYDWLRPQRFHLA